MIISAQGATAIAFMSRCTACTPSRPPCYRQEKTVAAPIRTTHWSALCPPPHAAVLRRHAVDCGTQSVTAGGKRTVPLSFPETLTCDVLPQCPRVGFSGAVRGTHTSDPTLDRTG
ncbi:hypothetical protein MHYP_G00281990 [Metynnis hypsauchen]